MNVEKITLFRRDSCWMAACWRGEVLVEFTFGHATEAAARRRIARNGANEAPPDRFMRGLIARWKRFLDGQMADNFQDVRLDLENSTPFQRSVIDHCRRIPVGHTSTYGELARLAGHARAARAVGQVMAANRFPLIVPCHRVVAANGRLGGFSSPQGVWLKQRLLDLEAAFVR